MNPRDRMSKLFEVEKRYVVVQKENGEYEIYDLKDPNDWSCMYIDSFNGQLIKEEGTEWTDDWYSCSLGDAVYSSDSEDDCKMFIEYATKKHVYFQTDAEPSYQEKIDEVVKKIKLKDGESTQMFDQLSPLFEKEMFEKINALGLYGRGIIITEKE